MRTIVFAAVFATATAAAQPSWLTVPPGLDRVPGNAGLSVPIRWDQGFLQLVVDQGLLPAALRQSPLQRLRLRRAVFLGEPAYPAIARTFEIKLGDTIAQARQLTRDIVTNRAQATLTTVVAARPYSVPATPAPGPGDARGADLVDLPLDAPFPFAGPNLILEWSTLGAAPGVQDGFWVDAVSLAGSDRGMAVILGNGGCGAGNAPMQLEYTGGDGPGFGRGNDISLTGAVPGAPLLLGLDADPVRYPPLGLTMGQSLAGLGFPGCHLWSGLGIQLRGQANVAGRRVFTVQLPDIPRFHGSRWAAQAVAVAGTGLHFSNGVLLTMNRTGVGDLAASVLDYQAGTTVSPWRPFLGTLPVLILGL